MGKKLLFCLLLLAGVGWVTADSLFGFTLPVGATAAVPVIPRVSAEVQPFPGSCAWLWLSF